MLIILLRLAAPDFLTGLWGAGGAISFKFRAGDDILRFERMVFVRCQLRLQAFGANCRRILITRAMRDKLLVCDI